jgi:hypothetical protein
LIDEIDLDLSPYASGGPTPGQQSFEFPEEPEDEFSLGPDFEGVDRERSSSSRPGWNPWRSMSYQEAQDLLAKVLHNLLKKRDIRGSNEESVKFRLSRLLKKAAADAGFPQERLQYLNMQDMANVIDQHAEFVTREEPRPEGGPPQTYVLAMSKRGAQPWQESRNIMRRLMLGVR